MALWQEWKNTSVIASHFGESIKYFYGGFIVFAIVLVVSFWLEQEAESRIVQKILETRLSFVANMLPELLDADFQDRCLLLGEINFKEHSDNIKKLQRVINISGAVNLKTLLKIGDLFYYTAYTVPVAPPKGFTIKLQAYPEAPGFYTEVLSTGKTQYKVNADGHYEIAATMFSPKGQSYLVVASFDAEKVDKLIFWQKTIRLASYFILALSIMGVYYFGTRSLLVCVQKVEALSQIKTDFELKAQRDDLTTLLRRDTFFAMLYDNLKFRHAEHQGYAVLMLDIDNFKRVNDVYGHMFGDEVIKLLAKLCLRGRAKTDLVGRYGGEEFIIFLDDLTKSSAISAAERIRKWAENSPLKTAEGQEVAFTVTVGGLWFKDAPVIVADYVYLADLKLLQGKKEGKNRVIMAEV